MKKKILIFCIVTVLMLVTISFTTAVSKTEKTTKKESPLYKIRTSRSVYIKNIDNLKEQIKTRFVRSRVFFIPIQGLNIKINVETLGTEARSCNPYLTYCCWTFKLEGC